MARYMIERYKDGDGVEQANINRYLGNGDYGMWQSWKTAWTEDEKLKSLALGVFIGFEDDLGYEDISEAEALEVINRYEQQKD